MDPKAQLLVFNKKEIFVILSLLVLVALFSFTLGLKLGKSLGASDAAKISQTESVPLTEQKEQPEPKVEEEPVEEKSEAVKSPDAKQHAEDQADAEFAAEADKEKVGTTKAVPMTFPKDKKGETNKGVRYTLQVGSHRTVAEATEQVSALKRKKIDAFYIEANVAGKGTWFRVGIGVFDTKEQAERAAVEWKAKDLPAHIVQKIGE